VPGRTKESHKSDHFTIIYTPFFFFFSLLELAEIKQLSLPNGRLGSAVVKVRQTVQLTVLGRGRGSSGCGGSISCSASIS
jgi:hypothetical protein